MKANNIKYFGFFWLIILPVIAVGVTIYFFNSGSKKRERKPVLREYSATEQIAQDDRTAYSKSVESCNLCGFSAPIRLIAARSLA